MGEATLIGIVKAFARNCLVWFGRTVVSPIVIFFARRPDGEELPVSVHLLVSSKTWKIGLLAALSLEYFSGRRWRLVFHDDGTLDNDICAKLTAKLDDVRLVCRAEAEKKVDAYLEGYPACRRNRGKHVFFLKFFDPLVYADSDKYLLLDSDVFFFRRPQELLDWATGKGREVLYNRDIKEVYCLPRATIEEAMGVKLWENFNGGLVAMSKEAMDLDLSEKLLQKFERQADHPQFLEQTLYAVCASLHGEGGALPATYELSWNVFARKGAICRHYVGPAKLDHLYFEGVMVLFYRMTLGRTD